MNFEEFKTEVLNRAKQARACRDQYRRAAWSKTWEELVEVVRDNAGWVSGNHIVTNDMVAAIERPELFGSGTDNAGLFNTGNLNTGNWNTGNWNTGNLNTGHRNTGHWNTGDRNTGHCNTGSCNTGHRNTGHRNTGNCNTGNWNTGNWNTGDQNTGHWNSGHCNTGDWNTGDCNSGYRNSGVFCNRGREDSIMMFNKDSGMSWDEWFDHPVYDIIADFSLAEWIGLKDMTEQEKADHPEAETTGGYLKTREYKEAWRILWDSLNDEQRGLFKTLPGYDADIFEDITGIRYE